MLKTLEICVDSLESGLKAAEAGADRLEVNSALSLGGLTPSSALVKLLKERLNIPLIAMIRPRHGYFTYTDHEFVQMQKEAYELINSGADGIAFGFLNCNGEIDKKRIKEFLKIADGRDSVFHRAFDILENHLENMQLLKDLGITRILTSGACKTAIQGRDVIKKLIQEADRNIEILPAGGIRPHNAENFIKFTGTDQIHCSCMTKRRNSFCYDDNISFIDYEIDDYTAISVDSDKVKKLAAYKG